MSGESLLEGGRRSKRRSSKKRFNKKAKSRGSKGGDLFTPSVLAPLAITGAYFGLKNRHKLFGRKTSKKHSRSRRKR